MQTERDQIGHHRVAGFSVHFQAAIFFGDGVVEQALGGHDVDGADFFVALPDLIVVLVVGGGDFDAAGTEFGLGPLVDDQRDFAIGEGEF